MSPRTSLSRIFMSGCPNKNRNSSPIQITPSSGLVSDEAASTQYAEAVALKGRNRKTRWRRVFQGPATLAERRQVAMNQALRESYEAYREAFSNDLKIMADARQKLLK